MSVCRYLWWMRASWMPHYSAHHELSSIVVWGRIHIHRGKLAGKWKRGLKSTGDSQFSSHSTAELKAVNSHEDTVNGQQEAPNVGVIFWNFCHKVNADWDVRDAYGYHSRSWGKKPRFSQTMIIKYIVSIKIQPRSFTDSFACLMRLPPETMKGRDSFMPAL